MENSERPTKEQIEKFKDVDAMNRFIASAGYSFTWGDGYFEVTKGSWAFQSPILSECQVEAMKHSGVNLPSVKRWIAEGSEIVETFKKYNFNMGGLVDVIRDEVEAQVRKLHGSTDNQN